MSKLSEKKIRNIALSILLIIVWYLEDFQTAVYALIAGIIVGYFTLFIINIYFKIVDRE